MRVVNAERAPTRKSSGRTSASRGLFVSEDCSTLELHHLLCLPFLPPTDVRYDSDDLALSKGHRAPRRRTFCPHFDLQLNSFGKILRIYWNLEA